MVYGVLRLINFAHGDVYRVGAVVAFFVADRVARMSLPPAIALPLVFRAAMIFCAALGFIIEYLAYRPLRNRPRLVLLITAIGVSLLLENIAQLPIFFGPTPKQFPHLIDVKPVITFAGGIVLTNFDLLSLGLSLALMIVLTWVVLFTRTGLALRAVSFRFDTAMLMGINTNRIISFTFMFGSALAAVAGVLDGIRYDVRPLMGVLPGLKAFVAAVLGGIGSIPGALVGGVMIGVVEKPLKGYNLPS